MKCTTHRILRNSIAICAMALASPALAGGFTISNGQTVTVQQVVNPGDIGLVEVGGTIDTLDQAGIDAGGSGGTVINHGSISANENGIYVFLGNVTNTGTSHGDIASGIQANYSIVDNSGIATGEQGIAAYFNNKVINSGSAIGDDIGLLGLKGNIFTNSGFIKGGAYSVRFAGDTNTLNLLYGTNIQGFMGLGYGNSLNIAHGLNTAFSASSSNLDFNSNGSPFLVTSSMVHVVDPTGFAAVGGMANDLTAIVAGDVDERLQTARGANSPDSSIWLKALGSYRKQKEDGNIGAYDHLLGGLTVGGDTLMSTGARAGLFAGAAEGRMRTNLVNQKIDSTNYFGGAYANLVSGDTFFDLSVLGGLANFESDRTVLNNMVAGGIDHASADYHGFLLSPSVTVGRDIHNDNGGTFTPSLRLRYTGLFLNSYDENGSAGDLDVNSRNVRVFETRGQLAYNFAAVQGDNSVFNAGFKIGADGVFSNSDQLEAAVLGKALDASGTELASKTARGFVGLDLSYATAGGASFHLGSELGYDLNKNLSAQAAAGFEIPL